MSLVVAGLQTDTVWEDPPANFARLAPQIARGSGGARLIVLPEMFS
jgi:predicted amidohydrolase